MQDKKKHNVISITDALMKAFNCADQKELDRFFEVRQGSVASWRNRNSIPFKYHDFIITKCNLSRDWFKTGQGTMFREDVKYDNSDHEEDVVKEKPATSDSSESFGKLRPDQIYLLKKWEKMDCKKRGAFMTIFESMEG